MTGLIHFVDEDVQLVKPYVDTLRARGFTVNQIKRADNAFDFLIDAREGDLVIIDIMLARGNPDRAEFSAEVTAESVETGLVLLDLLCKAKAPLFPSRAALFTHVERSATLRKAEARKQELGIPLWKKSQFKSGYRFAEAVEQHLIALQRRSEARG